MYDYQRASGFRRVVRRVASTRSVSWFLARTLHRLDRLAHRATRGRGTFSSWFTGFPVVMLTTTGARTGRPRTLPLVGIPDGDALVVIASNFGQRSNPAWYHNLRAHPRATVTVAGTSRPVVAEELTGAEWERYYQRGVDIHPGWLAYRRWAADRHIPVLRLTPAPDDSNH